MPKKQTEKKQSSALGLEPHLPKEGPGRDDMLQLLSWTFEDAWKAQDEWELTGNQGRGPIFRWVGAIELREIYEAYQSGDGAAILEAFHVCSLNSLPIPQWCEYAFLKAYRKVRFFKTEKNSWDEIFDRPHPKGTHLQTKRQEREKGPKVYRRIEEILRDEPGTPKDGALFERVGRELAIGGKTLTEGFYYQEKKRNGSSLEEIINNRKSAKTI
jgi:hypothetical protein